MVTSGIQANEIEEEDLFSHPTHGTPPWGHQPARPAVAKRCRHRKIRTLRGFCDRTGDAPTQISRRGTGSFTAGATRFTARKKTHRRLDEKKWPQILVLILMDFERSNGSNKVNGRFLTNKESAVQLESF
jgi:hypothetical protein